MGRQGGSGRLWYYTTTPGTAPDVIAEIEEAAEQSTIATGGSGLQAAWCLPQRLTELALVRGGPPGGISTGRGVIEKGAHLADTESPGEAPVAPRCKAAS